MNTEQTDIKQEPTHDCAEEVSRRMSGVYVRAYSDYDESSPIHDTTTQRQARERAAWIAVAKATPQIIIDHASADVKAWLSAKFSTASGWTKWIFGAVGAAAAAVTCLLASCTPALTPEQVQQWDAAHAAMHATTGTTCTLRNHVTVTPSAK